MALHKSPTSVTIAPTQDKSDFAEWVERYWKVGLGLAVAVSAAILVRQLMQQSEREKQQTSWEKLMAAAAEDPNTGSVSGAPETLKSVHEQINGSMAGAWSLYIAATSAAAAKQYDLAKSCLDELRSKYPDHMLVKEQFNADGKSTPASVIDTLEHRIIAERDWIAAHKGLFENPALPEGAPRVRINTDRGAIVVGLYSNLAPKQSENFLKLAREGFYSGTKFHRVVRGFLIQGGDPNSKQDDFATWGQGGPGYTLDREDNPLRHFAGVLSSPVAPGSDGKLSGSQFVITSADASSLDDAFVPFGKVLEGLEVVAQIDKSDMAEGSADRPATPVIIQSVEVL